MNDEYDFSNAERGKFHHPDAQMNLPIYLDDEVRAFVDQVAKTNGTDASSVVNQLLRSDMSVARIIQSPPQ